MEAFRLPHESKTHVASCWHVLFDSPLVDMFCFCPHYINSWWFLPFYFKLRGALGSLTRIMWPLIDLFCLCPHYIYSLCSLYLPSDHACDGLFICILVHMYMAMLTHVDCCPYICSQILYYFTTSFTDLILLIYGQSNSLSFGNL